MLKTFEAFRRQIKALSKNPLVNKLLFLVSIVYTLLLLFLSRSEIKLINWGVFWGLFTISFLLYFISLFLQCINWSLAVDGSLSNFTLNSEVFYRSILLQRIPGGFWHWLGRTNFYQEYDFVYGKSSIRPIRLANFYEWLLFVLTGLSIYLWTKNFIAGIVFSTVCLMTILFMFQRIRQGVHISLAIPSMTILLMLVRWGLGFYTLFLLLNNLIYPATVTPEFVLSTWTLSSTIAMATFFLPSTGIVRDFTLTALLAPTIPISKVILLAAELRIIFLISDLLSSGISLAILRIWKRKITKASL